MNTQNRTTMGQKRAVGKKSPLLKRPKLDFCSTGSGPSSILRLQEKANEKRPNASTVSDWDDDFPGDVLEEACLIADLSQAKGNNPEVLQTLSKEKTTNCSFKGRKIPNNNLSNTRGVNENVIDDLERLKLENEKLKENFKTKEGEVHILRSQLKQQQEIKQSETLHNRKIMEDLQQKYQEKLGATEKECVSVKTKLQFMDLELKSLKSKQLETSSANIRLVEPEAMHMDCRRSLFNASQVTSHQRPRHNERGSIPVSEVQRTVKEDHPPLINLNFPNREHHEGELLARLVCSEIYKPSLEPNIISFYPSNVTSNHLSRLDFEKREKYKWTGLPRQTVFIKDVYDAIADLFRFDNFSDKDAKPAVERICETCQTILEFTKSLLVFLNTVQNESNADDKALLDNEDVVCIVSSKMLLSGEGLSSEECSIEGRRALAVIHSLIRASKWVLKSLCETTDFFTLLKEIVESIGNLRRPIHYAGLLIGTALILNEVLTQDLNHEFLIIIQGIIEELVFARPKLNVLRELIRTLDMCRLQPPLLEALCRKRPRESCALYMDAKFKQASFFTRDTCALKLLQLQIMGQGCLPASRGIRYDITEQLIKWISHTIDSFPDRLTCWLPNSVFPIEEKCFDVTKCVALMLTLCVEDYKDEIPGVGKSDNTHCKPLTRENILSVIGHGAVFIRHVLQIDDRLLLCNSHILRFALELSSLKNCEMLGGVQKEAVIWISELVESGCMSSDGTSPDCQEMELLKSLRIIPNSESSNEGKTK